MPPAPPVQRKTVGRAVIAVLAILPILTVLAAIPALATLVVLRRWLRLAAGDE